jgi:hypothetical protein
MFDFQDSTIGFAKIIIGWHTVTFHHISYNTGCII